MEAGKTKEATVETGGTLDSTALAPADLGARPAAEATTVLVVDDDLVNRSQLGALLEAEGYQVLQAAGGAEALEIIERRDVSVVLLDVVMPELDGFETCRRIREQMGLLTLPVVFVTALEDRRSRVQGKEAGGDDFLTKPIDVVELRARVQNLVRVKAYHDLREQQRQLLEQEVDRMRDQLLRVDRLATLGTLAAGVGHELANALGILNVTIRLIRRSAASGGPPDEVDLSNLERVAGHLKSHSRHLLDMGRYGSDFAERVDLREVVRSTLGMLEIAGKTKHHEVQVDLPEREILVNMNRTRLEQVFINLVGNAADALQQGRRRPGRIRVFVERPSPEGRVSCGVEDDGEGVAEEQRAQVFEPYFTTKPAGEGTGLGLSVVRNIVRAYGGDVEVRPSTLGGACFSFDLPGAAPGANRSR